MTLQMTGTISRSDFSIAVNFAIGAGETLALVGRNGVGKSTVLSCIAGLVPLSRGELVVNDQMFDSPAQKVFIQPENRNTGMVFQRLHLLPHLSVLGNVEFALKARGKDSHLASVWLEHLQISHLASRSVMNLSGGEAQKVALARALAPEPQMLLLDEPLSAVDAESRADLRGVIASCLQSFGGIAVLVSHDSDDVVSLATSVIAL
jgi:molybdate transport system ATP-binding protein